MSVPLKRELHYRMKGRDVSAVQRALHHLSIYSPQPNGGYGHITENAVKVFQGRHGIKQSGVYGSLTHHHLSNNPAWDGYCDWLMSHTKLPDPTLNQRKLVVSAFMYCYGKRPLPYTEGAGRDDFMNGAKVLSNYPHDSDCSGTFTWCYWVRGLPDPNGLGYRWLGWTGTLAGAGRRVSTPGLGDAVLYGVPTIEHVAMYVGGGYVLSRGSAGGPNYLPTNAMGIPINEYRTYL